MVNGVCLQGTLEELKSKRLVHLLRGRAFADYRGLRELHNERCAVLKEMLKAHAGLPLDRCHYCNCNSI